MSETKKAMYVELLDAASQLVADRRKEHALDPVYDTLVCVRVMGGTYVSLGWLTQPLIDVGKGPRKVLDYIGDTRYTDLIKNVLDVWYTQFSRAIHGSGWAENYNALSVILESLKHGREFTVYVPVFKHTFRDAQALTEELPSSDTAAAELASFIGVYHAFYTKHLKAPAKVVEYDRELTDEERKEAVKKLEKIRRKIDDEQQFKLTTTRKLRMQLRYLAQKRPTQMVLDVCGWVVNVHEPLEGTFMINLPWAKREMDNDEFHDYVTAQSRRIPVDWEYLYMIDECFRKLTE